MTYIEAQQLTMSLQDDNKWDAFRHLDDSYDKSLSSGKWEDCDMPTFPKGYWEKGIPQSSYPKENGAWMTWRWRQPREENFIYCITEVRQPIDSTPNSKWESIITVGRKPLMLTSEAQEFFNNLNNNL